MTASERSAGSAAAVELRAAAVEVVERTLASRRPARAPLAQALGRFDGRDRRLLTELVQGTLRWLRRLDAVLESAANRRLRKIDRELQTPLRVGAYQLLFLDRVPAHAAVDTAVEIAGRRSHAGGTGFVNAVLRRIAAAPHLDSWPVREEDPVRRLGAESSHPDFLVRRWVERLGMERAVALTAANNRPKPIHLLAMGERAELAARLDAEGVRVRDSALAPAGLVVERGDPLATACYRDGALYVQDEGSQVAALVPPPAAGERVLDAAAAPGGKSFALLVARPDLDLTMADASPLRLATLVANRARLRFRAAIVGADARRPPFAGGFDRVLVDLPCSGTGTLRKHPELKWRVSEAELSRLRDQAVELLVGAAELVRPRGRLVVVTCSLEPEDNEDAIERLLTRRPELALEPLDPEAAPWVGTALETATRWRLWTGGDHDGFTVHSLVKR